MNAGLEPGKIQKVPSIGRQVFQLARRDNATDRVSVGVDLCLFVRNHLHRLTKLAHLQRNVACCHFAHVDPDLEQPGLKPWRFHLDDIVSGFKRAHRIMTIGVGGRREDPTPGFLCDGDVGVRNDGTTGVRYYSFDIACGCLRGAE